uniref:Uncharacterized protein n=1 Tax=Nelumbo nucifera TaxID=4432 RepID=A0A822XJK4_NELNU|nr:TPA_asm: hypothetical protein HUJ06_023177 [Nelumbo nucifera]
MKNRCRECFSPRARSINSTSTKLQRLGIEGSVLNQKTKELGGIRTYIPLRSPSRLLLTFLSTSGGSLWEVTMVWKENFHSAKRKKKKNGAATAIRL